MKKLDTPNDLQHRCHRGQHKDRNYFCEYLLLTSFFVINVQRVTKISKGNRQEIDNFDQRTLKLTVHCWQCKIEKERETWTQKGIIYTLSSECFCRQMTHHHLSHNQIFYMYVLILMILYLIMPGTVPN